MINFAKKLNHMKEKALNNGLKELQEKPGTFNEAILVSSYFIFLMLSINNNNLFLRELTLCGLIIIFSIISAQTKNIS